MGKHDEKLEGVTPADENSDLLRPTKIVGEAVGVLPAASTAGVYILGAGTAPSTTNFGTPIRILAADALYTLQGRAPMARIVGEFLNNAVAIGAIPTIGLYPAIVAGGGTGVVTATLAAASISVQASAFPGASSSAQVASNLVALPPDGLYVLGVSIGGTTAANSSLLVRARLELDWS